MSAAVDVLVIGGGQAGLAASYWLRLANRTHLVVDASDRIGDSWRKRYDSLTLFTPRSMSALPDMPLAGDPGGYAARDEFADYLEAYVERFALPVMTGTRVERLDNGSPGLFRAVLDNGAAVTARAVIVSTGAFRTPVVTGLSSGFSSTVAQLAVDAYRNPATIRPGNVLVVGDGASGRDVAAELARENRVILATGKPRRLFPEKVLGQSTWTWLDRLGLLSVPADSWAGAIMRRSDPFPDRDSSTQALKRRGVDIRSRLVGASGDTASFSDGTQDIVDTVIWAVGYREDFAWIDTATRQRPELFFLGRPWQRNRASALILGAGRDSRWVVDKALDAIRSP